MAVLIFFVCVLPLCLGCNAGARFKNKAKIVENYVLATNFEDVNVAQIRTRGKPHQNPIHGRGILKKEAEPKMMDKIYVEKDPFYQVEEEIVEGGFGNRKTNELKERDLILPGPGPHAHSHPSTAILSPHSVFAVGFITFLILLSNLQISLMVGKQKLAGLGGLLGGLNKPLGRRKRRALFLDPGLGHK